MTKTEKQIDSVRKSLIWIRDTAKSIVGAREEVKRALQILDAVSVVSWKSIDTMPHDKSWCFVWEKKYNCIRLARRGSGNIPTMGDWEYEVETATHWMPLPAAPTK